MLYWMQCAQFASSNCERKDTHHRLIKAHNKWISSLKGNRMEYSGIVDATDSFWRLYCKSKLNDCTLENRLHEGLRTPRMRKHVQKMWKVTTLWSSNVHANSLLIALQSWSAPHGLCPLNQNVCTSCSLQPWSQLTTRPIARWPAFGKTSLKANKLMLNSCTFRSAVIKQTNSKLKFNLQ